MHHRAVQRCLLIYGGGLRAVLSPHVIVLRAIREGETAGASELRLTRGGEDDSEDEGGEDEVEKARRRERAVRCPFLWTTGRAR
jgi:hypothetical protein